MRSRDDYRCEPVNFLLVSQHGNSIPMALREAWTV